MSLAREDVARLAGVSTATAPYVINYRLRSITRETRRRVLRAAVQPHCLPGAIGRNLVPRKTHFIGFILLDIPKPIHARWPGLSKKLREPLTAASLSGTAMNDPRVERACPAKLVSKKADVIGLTPAGTMIGCAFDGPATCVTVEGGDAYWRESSTVVRSGLGHVIMALA